METPHLPRTCKWSIPTLFAPWPVWLDAWTNEWTCTRDGTARPLEHSEHCRACPRWEEQSTGDRRLVVP
jgi:hypothetical protein